MKPLIACRNIAARSRRKSRLAVHPDASTDAIPIALRPSQGDREPMPGTTVIEKHQRFAAERGYNRVHPSVVIQIAKGRAAACDGSFRSGVGALESSLVV